MPSQPYNLVKDDQDLRVPLHSDEAFFNGITYSAKVGPPFYELKIFHRLIHIFLIPLVSWK
jgi:hypothetical protein